MADWQKIKTEYITTDTSYRKLAQKHGIHYKAVSDKGKAEDWVQLRSQYRDKTLSKALGKISTHQANKMARIDQLADKLLAKLDKAISELDLAITVHKDKVETPEGENTTEYKEAREGGVVDRAGLRQLTAALKDLKEVKGVMNELDRREQEARIAKLQREADGEDDDNEIQVVITGKAKEYAK